MTAPAYAPLRKTKITAPPPRPLLVERPGLIEPVESLAPLTLLSAPAGFGKTTLVASRLGGTGSTQRAAWLSLDEQDNDPIRFFYYLVATLQTAEPGIGRAPISLFGFVQTPDPRDLMTLLLNEFEETMQPLVLVLDDYHVINNPTIDAAVADLIDRLPPSMSVVIASRTEPNLPLHRWRAQRRLAEIGMDRLRFSLDEAAEFLEQTMGLQLEAETVRLLETRTDGWIAGLQMAALSLQPRPESSDPDAIAQWARAFDGRNRYVIDYLAAEVLAQQPPEIILFLRRTSILGRLCAPLCDALTGRADGRAMLLRLEQANMFLIRLDEQREWFRYHALFVDFLRMGVGADAALALHRKACAWYEAEGLAEEAFRHALTGEDIAAAVRIVRGEMGALCSRGQLPTALAWLQALPEPIVRAHDDLAGYTGWLLYLAGRTDEAKTYSEVIELTTPIPDVRGGAPPGQSTLLTFQSFLALNRNDPASAMNFAEEALRQFGNSKSFFRACALSLLGHAERIAGAQRKAIDTLGRAVALGEELDNPMMTLDALGDLAPLMHAQGRLLEAMLLCRDALARHVDSRGKPLPIAGLIHVPLGVLLYEMDELEAAQASVELGIDLCRRLGMAYATLSGHRALARIQHARDQREAAWVSLAAARESARRTENWQRRRSIAVVAAELQLHEGNLDAAARAFDELPPAEMVSDHENLIRAQLLLAQGRPAEAVGLLDAVQERAGSEDLAGTLIAVRAIRSVCLRALGKRAGAVRELELAVSMAASTGYRRVFLDQGPPLAALLGEIRGVAPEFVESLKESMAKRGAAGRAAGDSLRLSKTQVEVLRLLDPGLTNQEIADKLAITVGTVKWHMNQIFSKLQVRNRVEAVARFRESNRT